MNYRSLTFLILAASITAPVLVHQRGATRLRELESRRAVQESPSDDPQQAKLSRIVDNATNSSSILSPSEITELARLRNEARQLREKLRQRGRLEQENRRIEQALQNPAELLEPENPVALLAEEMPVRQARVAALREWLEQNPKEKIPELRFLTEDSWIRSADRNRVTDEEFEGWVSAQRGNAEARFGRIAYEAMKAFAQENNDSFPLDLAQLKPFFSTPIEDAILERYQIVPTKTLPKFLAEVGGEWAITQKAPINPQRDSRMAIGLKDRRGTLAEGRWDETP